MFQHTPNARAGKEKVGKKGNGNILCEQRRHGVLRENDEAPDNAQEHADAYPNEPRDSVLEGELPAGRLRRQDQELPSKDEVVGMSL